MEFPCRAIVTLLFLSFSPVCCSDLDHDVRVALAANQIALAEQSSALAKHSQALSRILEQNQMVFLSMSERIQELSQTLQQVADPSKCGVPSGYQRVSDGWFRVVNIKKTWSDARQYCQDIGSDLATPPSDFDALHRFVLGKFGNDDAWIGGRLLRSGEWIYVNGLQVNDHWYHGEPGTGEDCVAMDVDYDVPLRGRHCTDSNFFVCRYI